MNHNHALIKQDDMQCVFLRETKQYLYFLYTICDVYFTNEIQLSLILTNLKRNSKPCVLSTLHYFNIIKTFLCKNVNSYNDAEI